MLPDWVSTPLLVRCPTDCPTQPTVGYLGPAPSTIIGGGGGGGEPPHPTPVSTPMQVGVLLIWIIVGQGPTALTAGAGGVVWTFFLSSIMSLFFSPFLWETDRC